MGTTDPDERHQCKSPSRVNHLPPDTGGRTTHKERGDNVAEGHQGQGSVLHHRRRRILIIRHTDPAHALAGIQVPADGIEPGETPQRAALREAHQETGLAGLKVVRRLGEFSCDMIPYRYEIQRCHVFHLEPTTPTPERWNCHEDQRGTQPTIPWECSWIPLKDAHVLSGGQGSSIGMLFD
ncbi:NUDIX domain-containing protein [Streptomyces longispororuber]|uniref:NUDIX domain-containing protein n=1 Tax=Streptomyces longispororuber TaxID=68230 RepID=UPI002109804A|nr:NUDIX domain-containing protein [Streptomyces longispororuber]MCQ4210402.1 NUDIX domain-containing protein [Streptomyces longispororuber]